MLVLDIYTFQIVLFTEILWYC